MTTTAIRATIAGKSYHVHFVPMAAVDGAVAYTIEARRGQCRVTLGRVHGVCGVWHAVRVGAVASTSNMRTRREAAAQALAGRTFLDDEYEAVMGGWSAA